MNAPRVLGTRRTTTATALQRVAAAAAMTAVLGFAASARAEGNTVIAESLFREGRALMKEGDLVHACPKLAESYSQDPATGTLLALSLCEERQGKFASAWAHYHEALDRAKREGRTDRVDAAREQIESLEPRLSYLTIRVDASLRAVPGFRVKLDGEHVGSAIWDTPAPADPGEHVVEATAEGKQAFRRAVHIGAEADKQTVHVGSLEDVPLRPSPRAPVPPPAPAAGMSPLRLTGLVVGGVGVVTLGVSGFFGLRAASLNADSKSAGCDDNNVCSAEGLAKRDDAVSAANAATITLLAGGALAATGATLFILGGKHGSTDQTTVSATPLVGMGGAGLIVQGRLW